MKLAVCSPVLVLLCCGQAFGNACVDAATGSWNSPASWTSCGNVYPGGGDTATISKGHTITLTSDVASSAAGLVSLTISGSNNSRLVTDGAAPHTIYMGSTGVACGSNVASILVNQGVLDFSAATATNYITIENANPAYGWAIRETNYASGTAVQTVKLHYTHLIGMGTGAYGGGCGGLDFEAVGNNLQSVSVDHVLVDGGAGIFRVDNASAAPGYPSITNSTWVNTTGAYIFPMPCIANSGHTAWTITDNTFYLPANSARIMACISGSPDNLTFARNFVYWGSTASGIFVSTPGATSGDLPYQVEYNVDLQNAAAASSTSGVGIQSSSGTSSGLLVAYNMCQYVDQCLYPYVLSSGQANSSWLNNWMLTNSTSGNGQGQIFMSGDGYSVPITVSNNIMVFDAAGSENGLFTYNGGVVSATGNTVYTPANSGVAAFAIGDSGEYPTGNGTVVLGNLTVGGKEGIWDNAASVYGTSGTGGVGVAGNDFYGAATAYYTAGTSTNFGTRHPNSSYGDVSINPALVAPLRHMADFDTLMGGPGTDAHLAQEFAARCGLTAATGIAGGLAYSSAYTTQNLYQFLTSGFAPSNISLGGKNIGAQLPVVMGAW